MKVVLAAIAIGAALCSPARALDAKITDEAQRICDRYNLWVEQYQGMAKDMHDLYAKAQETGDDLLVKGLQKMSARLQAGFPTIEDIRAAAFVLGKPC